MGRQAKYNTLNVPYKAKMHCKTTCRHGVLRDIFSRALVHSPDFGYTRAADLLWYNGMNYDQLSAQFFDPGYRFVRVFLPNAANSIVDELVAHGLDKALVIVKGNPRHKLSWPELVQQGICLVLDRWDNNDDNRRSYTRQDIYKSYLRFLLSATVPRPSWRAVAVGNLGVWKYKLTQLNAITYESLGDLDSAIKSVKKHLAKRCQSLSKPQEPTEPASRDRSSRKPDAPDEPQKARKLVFETRSIEPDERETMSTMITKVFSEFSSWDELQPSSVIPCDTSQHPVENNNDWRSLFDDRDEKHDPARLHALICFTHCGGFPGLLRASNTNNNNHLPDPNDMMVVPTIINEYPCNNGWSKPNQAPPDDSNQPPPDDDHSGGPERLAAFLRTQTVRRKRYRGVLRIRVDDRHVHTLDPFDPLQPLTYELSVDNYSRFIEIFGEDQGGELLLAIIPISDIDDLEENSSLNFTITQEGGQRFRIRITASRDPSGALIGYRVRLKYDEKRILRAATFHSKRLVKRYGFWPLAPIVRIPYLREAMIVMLLLALVGQAYLDNSHRQGMERQLAVMKTVADDYRQSAQLLVSLAKGYAARVEKDASRIEVVAAVARGHTFPYPTFGDADPLVARALAEELQRSPARRAEYEAYLLQWADIFRALGSTLAQVGKIPEAIRVFAYLIESMQKPNTDIEKERLLGLFFGISELYKMDADHRAAIHVYDEIIERGLAPNDPRPHHYAGWSWYILRDYEKALAYYDDALRIDPQYAKVLYNKALIFRDTNQQVEYRKHLDKAIELTEEAYQREGDANPRIPFSLAIFYAEKGDLENALAMLERACAVEPFYVVRAEKEQAFDVFRDPESTDHSKYQVLLLRHRVRQHALGSPSSTYDPTVFNE